MLVSTWVLDYSARWFISYFSLSCCINMVVGTIVTWLQRFNTLDAGSRRYEVRPLAVGINDQHQQKSSTKIHSRPHVFVRLLEARHPRVLVAWATSSLARSGRHDVRRCRKHLLARLRIIVVLGACAHIVCIWEGSGTLRGRRIEIITYSRRVRVQRRSACSAHRRGTERMRAFGFRRSCDPHRQLAKNNRAIGART